MTKFLVGVGRVTDAYGVTLRNVSIYHEDDRRTTKNKTLRYVCYINLKPVRVYSLYRKDAMRFYVKDKNVSFNKLANRINKLKYSI